MALRWEYRLPGRWHGVDGDGQQIGWVAETVTNGGGRYWFAWRRDATPDGLVVGDYGSAEEAMAAVDASLAGNGGSPWR